MLVLCEFNSPVFSPFLHSSFRVSCEREFQIEVCLVLLLQEQLVVTVVLSSGFMDFQIPVPLFLFSIQLKNLKFMLFQAPFLSLLKESKFSALFELK